MTGVREGNYNLEKDHPGLGPGNCPDVTQRPPVLESRQTLKRRDLKWLSRGMSAKGSKAVCFWWQSGVSTAGERNCRVEVWLCQAANLWLFWGAILPFYLKINVFSSYILTKARTSIAWVCDSTVLLFKEAFKSCPPRWLGDCYSIWDLLTNIEMQFPFMKHSVPRLHICHLCASTSVHAWALYWPAASFPCIFCSGCGSPSAFCLSLTVSALESILVKFRLLW